jgi:hypothetical protein
MRAGVCFEGVDSFAVSVGIRSWSRLFRDRDVCSPEHASVYDACMWPCVSHGAIAPARWYPLVLLQW